MRIKFPSIIRLLLVLAIVCSLAAIAAVPASAATGATLTPNIGPVATGVTINATDFIPSAILTVKFDGAALATNPATVTTGAVGETNEGDAIFGITIPTTTFGAHEVKVSDGTNTDTKTFTVQAKVIITSPTTKKGPVGTSVSVAGTGFSGAGVTADVTIGGAALVSGVAVDNTGSFTATGNVPTLGSGAKTVTAIDGAGNAAAITDSFSVTPTLTLTPNSGLAGSKVTISGNGWSANKTVTFTFAGTSWKDPSNNPYVINIDALGIILAPNIVIPVNSTAGTKTVVGTDTGATPLTGSTTFTVQARPLTLTPNSGPRGTQVLITGSQMTPSTVSPPNSKIDAGLLDLTFGGAEWNPTTEITIDSAGVISPVTRYVPVAAALGANVVLAWDNGADFSHATTTDNLNAQGLFTVTQPTLTLNPTTGPKGTSVTMTGSGWVPLATVTLTFVGATNTQLTTIPDANGNIAAAMNVPADAARGPNQVTAADGKGNAALAATFTVPGAAISVSPAEGPVTTSVAITGTGFNAYTAITIKIGGYTFLNQPLSSAIGDFTFTITVPGVAPGSQVISASDGTSTATTFFVVKEAPPTVQSALAGISSYVVRVWGYYNGVWQMYDPADPVGSTLTTLTPGRGYWINVNAACTLIYSGFSYALSSGWNLVGWR